LWLEAKGLELCTFTPLLTAVQNGTLLSHLDLKASMFKIGFIKLGNIATSLVADLALDEIAERTDVEFKVISFGPR